jgi:hypothetical protein
MQPGRGRVAGRLSPESSRTVVVYHYSNKFTTAEIAIFVKSWQNSKAVRRNFNPVPFTVQLHPNEFWNKLGSLLAKFCIRQAVPGIQDVYQYYSSSTSGIFILLQTRTAFRRFRGRKNFGTVDP